MSKIPATIITGFLGSGKTTLIRRLLEQANGARIALIVNEFGDLGVDGDILKSCIDPACADEDVIELANGCICCTVADDFLPTMQTLLARRPAPDHIVIETSGLALPQPLVQAFNWPEIKTRVTVDGVVTLIDAAALAEGRVASDEAAVARQRAADLALDHDDPIEELFEDQVRCADLLVLNKSDLLAEGAVDDVLRRLGAYKRTGVRVVPTSFGDLPLDALLGLGIAAEDDVGARASTHADEDDHDHDDFESFVVALEDLGSPEEARARVAAALDGHAILRVKGFLPVRDKPRRLALQAVGTRIDTYYDTPWTDAQARVGRLVIIGERGLDRGVISEALGGRIV